MKIEMFVMSDLIAEPYGGALVRGDGGAEQGEDWLEADCAPTEAVGRAVEQQFKETQRSCRRALEC